LLDLAATAFKKVSPVELPKGQGYFPAPLAIPVQLCPRTSVNKKQIARSRSLNFTFQWINYRLIFQAFAGLIFWLGI